MLSKEEFLNQIQNWHNAIQRLKYAIDKDNGDDLIRDAIIQRFEFTIELSWKTLKKFLVYKWEPDNLMSKDIFRKFYEYGIVTDIQIWIDFIDDRNLLAHIYSEEQAIDVYNFVKQHYGVFEKCYTNFILYFDKYGKS